MRAVFFRQHGGPEVIEEGELPDPLVGATDVRVRVKACALNHLDLWVRGGLPGLKLPLPHVLGSDVAGVVESVGKEVSDLKPGAEVVICPTLSCGSCEACLDGRHNHCRSFKILGEHVPGGYAELVTVPRVNIFPKPSKLSFDEAACLPLVFLTAHHMLVRRAQLKAGETVLVLAAGSGVGSAAIQIARQLGAKVIATAGSDAKLERARALGASEVINHEKEDFAQAVKKITGGRGADVVFEHVGLATWKKSLASLAFAGRLVTCGATTGPEVPVDLRFVFFKQQTILGSTMGTKAEMFDILRHVEAGHYKPVLDRAMPLSQARAAQAVIQDRAQFGKVVLNP